MAHDTSHYLSVGNAKTIYDNLKSEFTSIQTAIENLRAGFVPTAVRQSLFALLSAAVYTQDGLEDAI